MSTDRETSPAQNETNDAKTLKHETETSSKNSPPSLQATPTNTAEKEDLKKGSATDAEPAMLEKTPAEKDQTNLENTSTTKLDSPATDKRGKSDSAAVADPNFQQITPVKNETASTHLSPPQNSSTTQIREQPETDHDTETRKKDSATDADPPPVQQVRQVNNESTSKDSSPPNNISTGKPETDGNKILAEEERPPKDANQEISPADDENKSKEPSPQTTANDNPETQAAESSKQDSTNDAAPSPKKISTWKRLILCLQKGKISEPKSSQSTKAEATAGTPDEMKLLSRLIQEDVDYMAKRAKELGHYNDIDSVLKEAYEYLGNVERRRDVECLRKLRKDVMKLKLQYLLKYKSGADVKGTQKKLWLGFKPKQSISEEVLHVLHRSDVFETSMEFKDFEARYNELPPELKRCLLCFSVFPEKAIIKKRLMVHWWVAEGFASEDEANKRFNQLIEEGFIEPVNRNRSLSVGSCQMHPFNRSALVVLAERAKFFNFDARGEPTQNFSGSFQACLVGKGLVSYEDLKRTKLADDVLEKLNLLKEKKMTIDDLEKKLKENNSTDDVLEDLHLPKGNKLVDDVSTDDVLESLHLLKDNKLTDADLEKKLRENKLTVGDLEKLHLLINMDEHILDFRPDWFSKMTNLNFLYLGRWKVLATDHIEVEDTKFLDKLENMSHVKFLSLQGVSNVIALPNSFLRLTDLNILDLRACYNLETIPERIEFLRNLTHLDMSECYLLDHMPKSLSSLKELRVLKGFVVGIEEGRKRTCCTLDDLENLKKLIKLCIYTGLEKFPEKQHVTALAKLEQLCKLTITWGVSAPRSTTDKPSSNGKKKEDSAAETKKQDPQRSSESSNGSTPRDKLPRNLEKLDLKCFPMSTTPHWLQLNNLKNLNLEKLYIRGGKFSDLGQYQDIDGSGLVQPVKKETWNVKVLRLKYLSEIEMEWRQLQELFPHLDYLEQVSCPKLTLFPCDANGVWIKRIKS